mgnify:CR=1 FL=1
MKIHFINPCDRFLEKRGDRAPLGILQLSAWCKEMLSCETKIWDMNHDNFFDVAENILYEQPNFICISVSTPNYKQCITLARLFNNISPGSSLIAGGVHVTDFPDESQTLANFDFVIQGDGEVAMKEII